MVPEEIGAASNQPRSAPRTWEAVNRVLVASAKQDKLEEGTIVRIDSTVTAALMHDPSDSTLLWDAWPCRNLRAKSDAKETYLFRYVMNHIRL